MVNNQDLLLFAGSSHPVLAKEVADYLQIKLSKVKLDRFPDGEISLQILDNVRGRDVFALQSVALNPNDYLMELLIMVDTLRRASAKSVTAVIPYYGYCRQDRKDKPRVPITAKLVANLLINAGANRVLTMDLHTDQIQGFFDIPVDNLRGSLLLSNAFRKEIGVDNLVVVTPDVGSIKLARAFACQLGVDYAIVDKQRYNSSHVEVVNFIGDVKGKDVLLADDMCSTAGTLTSAATACQEKGAKRIFAAISHGIFVGDSVEKIERSPIQTLYVCNTIQWTDRLEKATKIKFVSVANLLGRAINCIMSRESVSSLCSLESGEMPTISH